MRQRTLCALLSTLSLSYATLQPAHAAGDPVAGKRVYEDECAECHTTNGKTKKGPSLLGMFGRKAGAAPGYEDNSPEMKASGITWSEDTLDKYLTMPRKFLPGVKMKYEGLPDAKARTDLIAFIATLK
jgi:cytochrome c